MLVPATPPPPDCPRCTEAEKYIFALEADIEYLRSVALRNEFVCSRCENDDKSISSKSRKSHQQPKVSSSVSVGSTRKKRERTSGGGGGGGGGASVSNSVISTQPKPESMSLAEASQRLVDVTARHKRQIEQMTKERARWQNDMHLKLSKFAMMCKGLNEESAKRKDDATIAQSELTSTRTERDALSSEAEILRARVELYEKNELENASIREMLRSQDNETLNWADDQVKWRDDVIEELSLKLEKTLDTLQMERQQQRIRRQIIFPVARSASLPMSNSDVFDTTSPSTTMEGGNNPTLSEQLVKAKDEARTAEASLAAARIDAYKREECLRERCKQLEMRLYNNTEEKPNDAWWDERGGFDL